MDGCLATTAAICEATASTWALAAPTKAPRSATTDQEIGDLPEPDLGTDGYHLSVITSPTVMPRTEGSGRPVTWIFPIVS